MSNLISKTSFVLITTLLFSACGTKGGGSTKSLKNPSVATSAEDYFKVRPQKELTAKDFVAASQSEYAGKLAAEAYEKSKNLIDAFVVMSFALAVERPQSTGLAGGGFLLLRHGQSGQVMAIDFREMAPRKATAKMYFDGETLKEIDSREGVRAAGVPGFVAGVLQAHMLFGRTPVKELLAPVVKLAREGFPVYAELAYALEISKDMLLKDSQAAEIFFKNGKALRAGDLLVQENLAKTIEAIGKSGRNGFYRGDVAKAIVEQQKAGGGIIEQSDLNGYQVKMRTDPVRTVIGDYQIFSMPPPSSGGTAVVEILNTLEALNIKDVPAASSAHYHLFASASQKAFADRAKFMGDPDYVPVPFRRLSSKKHAKEIAASLDPAKAKASRDADPELWDIINPNKGAKKESTETTHFSMMDARGSMLASTQTVNGFFGAQVMVPGTGFFLNNEMNDFSVAAGVPNLYGAVGSKANEIQARKRPLSSMSPTLVMKKWKPMLALGTPSGTRIISCVANVLTERLYREKDLYSAVSALRTHHQWYPEELRVEAPGFTSNVKKELVAMGHKVVDSDLGCRISAVEREDKILKAVVDPRGYGKPVGLGLIENVPTESAAN
ncbi:MAG TPA: gamma-glutamyltransferase [Bdellovibrionota bacterium]|nr:gamma-glutamyltransferase [Bdellovibrionota bacterium]